MARPGSVSPAVVVGGLTLLALVLRLAVVRDSLLGDELIMFGIVHDRGLGDVLHVVRATEKTPPLHFVLAWGSARLGDPTLWIRLPSLLAGTALVPLAYRLGRDTVGRRPGLIAAAIVALAPFALFYATEARAYALVAFLAAVSTICLLRALDTGRIAWWAAYVAAVLAVAYTHYAGIFVLAAQAGWAFAVQRERLRELVAAHALIVVGFVPWIPSYLVQQGHSGDEARRIAAFAPPTLEYFARANAQVLLGEPFAGLHEVPGTAAAVVALVVLGAALAAAALRARGGARPGARGALVILLALATPLGIGLLSLAPDQSWLLPRNMSASLPALAVLVGWLLATLARSLAAVARPLAAAAVAAFLLALAVGTAQALRPDNRRTPFRSAAHWIDDRAQPGDPVVQQLLFGSGSLGDVLRINFARPHPLLDAGAAGGPAAWARAERVFVVRALPDSAGGAAPLAPRAGPDGAFELVAERRYAGLGDVVVGEYRRRPD
jgi:4-amino-4-deoxy-L-arabinose transferase-like glycosyltransferase